MRIASLFAALLTMASASHALNYTVTNTADSGSGSLRQAITDANTNPGPDVVAFNIAGPVPHVIALNTQLPSVTEAVTLDATTQPGWAPMAPVISINGQGVFAALQLQTSNSIIRGFHIYNSNMGVYLDGGTSNTVQGCFIGTDISGNAAATAGTSYGIGVSVSDNNLFGGPTTATRNLLSGNSAGIVITGLPSTTCSLNRIVGNYIGVNASGTAAIPNQQGVYIGQATTGTLVGGKNPGEGNLISGNSVENVTMFVECFAVTFHGNTIGPDITGNVPLNTAAAGIRGHSVSDITIGGTGSGEGNLISGNSIDIHLFGIISTPWSNWNIYGNRIGTNSTGTGPLLPGITNSIGIRISAGAHDIRIGGASPGMGNIVAYHMGAGVRTSSDVYNISMLGNLIFENSIAIDLEGDGLNMNDSLDSDDGANHLQNFPDISAVQSNGVDTSITGILSSEPSKTYRIEFFDAPTCGSSGQPNAKRYIGATNVTTNGVGHASYSLMYQFSYAKVVTATATDADGNTSEYSPCKSATLLPTAAHHWELYR